MRTFKDFLTQREWYGGSANDPSNVNDEGDGGDGVEKRMIKPGAFPAYSDDELPITAKNRKSKASYMKKGSQTKKPG